MEKQKLIYVESKALFSPSEVSDKAIVFIKDTKEIWTHGVYFSCSGVWASPITLSLTGDTTGSVSIDGSGNASIATTTLRLSASSYPTDANNAASTAYHNISYYRVNSNTSNLFPVVNNANGILSLNVHDYSYTHLLGFSSNGNIYHRRRNGGTWETTWKTILNSSNYTNFPHTFASLTNKPTTLSGYGITDCIPIISSDIVTTDTDLGTLGMTTFGAKFSISRTNNVNTPSWGYGYSNYLIFRSTGDTYSGISTDFSSGVVTFIGGRNLETTANNVPNWWFRIKGASGITYDLNSILNIVNNIDSNYLRKSGGTMTGALNFANNTWNKVGDDAYMGDCNVSGMIGIKGSNAATPGFAMYNNSGTLLGKLYASGPDLYWSGVKLLTSTGSAQEAYLAWGGQNLASNSSPIDTILVPSLGANRLAFLSPDAIDIEYSQDGGTTWLNYNATDAQKVSLFCGGGNYSNFYLGGNSSTDPSIDRTPWRLRITISVIGYSLYCQFIKFLIYTTDVGNTTYCLLLGRKYSDYQNNVDTWVTFLTARIAGWSGWNTINHPNGIILPHTANYAQLRFEFYMTSLGTTGRASIISRIEGFAHKCWSWPSNMAGYGNIYSYDWQLNVTFPAQVTATGGFSGNVTGNLIGNADTASNISTVNPILALPFEKNTIQVVSNPLGALAELLGTAAAITHALRFNWYNTAYEIGNVRGGASNSLGFGITYGNNNLCLLVKTNGTYSPYGFIGSLSGNADTASKWKDARTITLTGDVTGSVTLDGSSNVTLATTTSGTGTTSFLKCLDKRNSYPALIVTSGGNIGAAFMSASKLGLSDGSYYDAVILRGYVDGSGGNENALLFSKNSSSVYHSQYAFGSTTTWGTIYKFLDSNNYSSYALPLSGGTMTGNIILTTGKWIADSTTSTSILGTFASGNSTEGLYSEAGVLVGKTATQTTLSSNGDDLWHYRNSDKKRYKILDAANYTNYTINYAKFALLNAGSVGVIKDDKLYYNNTLQFARFVQHDNSGRFSYELIAELTNYGTGTNTSYITYGISGFMWAWREGNGANSGAYPITAIVNVGPAILLNMLRIPVTTNALIPFVVKYNDKYYIALRKNVSSTTFYFMGAKFNLLTTSIIVDDASLIEEIAGPITETSTAKYYYNNGTPKEYLHAGNYSSYALPLTGGTLTGDITVPSVFINTGDATLKFYSGKITDAKSDGNICLLTSIDGTNGLTHVYPTQLGDRCNLVLLPRGGQVYIGTNPDGGNTSYKLFVNGGIHASSLISDKVGIGTSSPTEKLQVNGNAIVEGSATVGTYSTNNSLTIKSKNSSGVAYLHFDNGYYAYGDLYWKGYIAVSGYGDTSMRTEGNGLPGEDQSIHGMIFKLPRVNMGNFSFRAGNDKDMVRINSWGLIIVRAGYIVSGGTSSLFLKADGSLDSSNYYKIGTELPIYRNVHVRDQSTGSGIFGVVNSGSDLVGGTDLVTVYAGTSTLPFILRTSSDDLYHYNHAKTTRYKILDSFNVSSYALSLSGGTLGNSTASYTNLFIKSSTAKLRLMAYSDSANYIQSGNSTFDGNATLKITGYNSNTGSNLYLNFANIYCRGGNYTNIDSGNYSSYALPLSGGTLTGTLISRDIRPSANVSYSLGTSSYYYNYVYAKYFKKNGSSDSYVLLGGGGHKAVSDFAPNNVATLSSSGMGNSDLWTLVFEQSYPASHWYEPIAMFYVKGGTVGCGILCFYNYWNSATKLDAYEKEVWFFGAGKSETSATFGGTNRDINDYLRIYIDTANFKYYIYYNRYNDRGVKILELLFFESPDSLHSSFFTNSTTVVNLPTESNTLVRVPIKTTYNHDRTIKTSKSIYASSFYENSDIRLKENIRRIDLSDLTKLVDLVQFNFKDSDTKKYGVIAQLLELVGLQNLVYENDGKKAVDYISLLVLEIQRLRNEIGELKLEINKKS